VGIFGGGETLLGDAGARVGGERAAEEMLGGEGGVGVLNSSGQPIVLFDGECNFCNSAVNFILRHERDQSLRFAASQSEFGQRELASHGLPAKPGSIVLVEGGRIYTKSSASLRLARYLRRPWRWLGALAIIPAPVRDMVYGWVAANRHRLTGRAEQCRFPTEELKSRFLS
jgi:predicted DCC family thiol-disulfide oxidoreductase YuxK